MPKLAANLSMMFNEVEFLERFSQAADCGFTGVEFLFPYDWSVDQVVKAKESAGVEIALFNLPPGDWGAGERGIACLPGREEEFAQGLDTALPYAQALGLSQIHAMAGLKPEDVSDSDARATYVPNLQRAADFFAPHGLQVLLEPINNRDMPGYYLNYQQQALDLMDEAGRENLGLQMDFYHCQIMQGDLLPTYERNQARVAHIQIAGANGRHEPDTGEVDYSFVLKQLDRLGYDGWVGCEYKPAGETRAGLDWAKNYGISG